ncbi:GNAT family N-acetyltransferase [Candidatus Saccharibacteria bacterium]|nr:GNAT family N-acetyltransferase [Candidatus Saccharibacteria bacterium]
MLGPELETKTRNHEPLTLTRPDLDHATTMLTWAQDAESMNMLAAPDSEALRDKANIYTEVERIKNFETDAKNITWAIIYKGNLVGQVWIYIEKEPNVGHISTIVGDKSVRNKGIGLASKSRVLDWAFKEGGFLVIKAWCIAQNTISEKGLRSLGFVYTHQDNNDEIVAGERPVRHHYEMTAEHWKSLR